MDNMKRADWLVVRVSPVSGEAMFTRPPGAGFEPQLKGLGRRGQTSSQGPPGGGVEGPSEAAVLQT